MDPSELVRTQMVPISGKIDEIVRMIEDFLDTLESSSQGIDTKNVEANQKKVTQEMFKDKKVRSALHWIMIRMSISNILAEELRTYEITNNGGLGLQHDQLVNYIRNLEG